MAGDALLGSGEDGEYANALRNRLMAKAAAKSVRQSSPKPVYVLVGHDAYLLDAARQRVLTAALDKADPQTCLGQHDGDAELAAVLDELRTLPLLGSRRVVIVNPADEFVSAHREALEKVVQSPPPHAVLVLVVSSWPSNTRLAKAVAEAGEVIDCSVPERGSLNRWITEAAERRGKKLDRDAAELLEQWVGRDYAALDSEIEKMSLYAGSRKTLTVQDVSAVTTATAGPAAFALSNALTAGDARAALEALGGMLTSRGEEFRVLGLIAWHLRRVLAAARKVQAGEPPAKALPYLPPEQKAALAALIRHRPVRKLAADFRRLLRADQAMKSGADARTTLEELVVGLCSPAAAVSS
jgi:DNA polymerase-3 subunit delta